MKQKKSVPKNSEKNNKSEIVENNSTKDKKSVDRTPIYVALIGLLGTIILACFGLINTFTQILLPVSINQALISTRTSVPVFSTPSFTCGTGEVPILDTPVPIYLEPTLIVFLIDENVKNRTLENVLSSLDTSLEIGDRVIFLAIGEQIYNEAVISDEVIQSTLSAPILSASPTPKPVDIITIDTPGGTFQQISSTATAQAMAINATQISSLNLCSVYEWNISYQSNYSQWEQETQNRVSESTEILRTDIQDFVFKNSTTNTVFESLRLVSNIFAIECNLTKYKRCIFVPIFNMVDYSQQSPSEVETDFSNIDVIGTTTNCSLYDQECRDGASYWQGYLNTKGAKSVQFLNLDEFWETLIVLISR